MLQEIVRGDIPVLIARAPEFYGPGRTQSFTNALILDRIRAGRTPLVPVRDDRRRTLIWTPDASRALALLGNAPDAFGQTWHLPVDPAHPTYRDFVEQANDAFGRPGGYRVLPRTVLTAAGLFSRQVRELRELLPRYQHENIFDSSKFASAFPAFDVTTYREGLRLLREE